MSNFLECGISFIGLDVVVATDLVVQFRGGGNWKRMPKSCVHFTRQYKNLYISTIQLYMRDSQA